MPHIDDVVVGEALGAVQLAGCEHSHADIDNYVGRALDRDGAIPGGDGRGRIALVVDVVGAVVAHHEGRYAQCARLILGSQGVLDQCVVFRAGRDGGHQFIHGAAARPSSLLRKMLGQGIDQSMLLAAVRCGCIPLAGKSLGATEPGLVPRPGRLPGEPDWGLAALDQLQGVQGGFSGQGRTA